MNFVNINKLSEQANIYEQVLELKRVITNIWWTSSKEFNSLGIKTNYWYKRRKEKETTRFLSSFIRLIEQYPANKDEQKSWKKNINEIIDDFIDKSDLVTIEDKELLLKQGLLEVTKKFVNEARAFDPSLDIEDIGQAMRNVWIMSMIQMLLGQKVQLTHSVCSYNMLYPYTDNYLDDKKISKEEKLVICNRFEKRLEGYNIEPSNKYEEKIFQLVGRIEDEFNRLYYPQIYESLLSIHRAQIKSLKQQGNKTGPYEEDILGISIEKGGISVLTDAYFVKGNLSEDEAIFFFGYGFLLQICDDLQDAVSDYNNDQMTIASQLNKKWPLDNITNKLINFTINFIDNTQCFDCSNIEILKELIKKNCLLLILFSVTKNKKLYTRKYYSKIKQYFPYRERYMRNLYKRLKKKLVKLEESYNGTKTEDIIMNALS